MSALVRPPSDVPTVHDTGVVHKKACVMHSTPFSALTLPASKASSPGRLVISVEGNIGIGKSTLLENLRERFRADSETAHKSVEVSCFQPIQPLQLLLLP